MIIRGLLHLAAASQRQARVVRISRIVGDLARSVDFYTAALGFVPVSGEEAVPEAPALRLGTARRVRLRLGAQEVALVACTPGGAPYPTASRSDDRWFQHLAIVVGDMQSAMQTLAERRPRPISDGGAQALPARNGGVTAFKFRDPDGHPLELLQFPAGHDGGRWHRAVATGPFLGIDHSAIAIGSGRRSLRFYGRLGFRVVVRSFNHGPAQARLDGLPGAAVHVTALRLPGLPGAGFGLELLRYMPPGRARPVAPASALWTDWLTVQGLRQGRTEPIADPDGHLLLLEG